MEEFTCFNASFSTKVTVHCCLIFYLLPTICGLGFFLNIACAGIFACVTRVGSVSQPRQRKRLCMRPYLIALSIFDALVLSLSIFVIILPNIKNFLESTCIGDPLRVHDLQNFGAYSIRFLYPLLMSANYASIWTITVIAIQRYFAICYPLASRHRYHFLRKSKSIIGTIVAVSLLFNLSRFFEFHLIEDDRCGFECENSNSPAYGCLKYDLIYSEMGNSSVYHWISDGLVYPSLLYMIPFIILATLNYRIVRAIGTTHRRLLEPRLSNISVSSNQREKHWEQRSALMVLAIVVLFFSCHTLPVVTRWWEMFRPQDFRQDSQIFGESVSSVANQLSNFLVSLNSALNPFIYFFFTRMFREFYVDIRSKRRSGKTRQTMRDIQLVNMNLNHN